MWNSIKHWRQACSSSQTTGGNSINKMTNKICFVSSSNSIKALHQKSFPLIDYYFRFFGHYTIYGHYVLAHAYTLIWRGGVRFDARGNMLRRPKATATHNTMARELRPILYPISNIICIEIRSVQNQKRYIHGPVGELGIVWWQTNSTRIYFVYMTPHTIMPQSDSHKRKGNYTFQADRSFWDLAKWFSGNKEH